MEQTNKTCIKCGKIKSITVFAKSAARSKDGTTNVCKVCRAAQQRLWNKDHPEQSKAISARYLATLQGILHKRLVDASIHAAKNKLDFDLTFQDLNDLYNAQLGICMMTGIKFEYASIDGVIGTNPYSISIDRIDSKRGYTKDNVRIVCWAVNAAKQREKQCGYSCDLTLDWLDALYTAQNSKCALTGIVFDLSHNTRSSPHPYGPSLDRIASKGRYTADNVRLVNVATNIALGPWGEATLRHIAECYVARKDLRDVV